MLRALVELAQRYAAALPGREVAPPTAADRLPDHLRRRHPPPAARHRCTRWPRFLHDHVGDLVSDVHLLPMFPWTSDDGFAVVDHRAVNPALGSWADVAELAAEHAVMFDFVANHTSSHSPWFLGWLAGDPAYAGFYVEQDPDFDESRVVRPRTTPLHHAFPRPDGTKAWAWTTFGEDQVDVDVRHPRTLLELTDVLLGYLVRGASAVRLDAIGFLWKESGTTCLHLPQTHAVIKLWRALVDQVAPGTRLLTETNVPHAENISYFGDGHDEAHLVYQFALPPLVLHSFVAGSTARLGDWAAGVGPGERHRDLVQLPGQPRRDRDARHRGDPRRPRARALVERTHAHGGRVSWASRPDGSRRVYELNLSYLDALCTVEEARDPAVLAAKALAAHSILFAFLGVPAVYYHSLVGSPPDLEGMVTSRINRRINRAVLDADRLVEELRDDPRRRAVFAGMRRLLDVRRQHEAFSPFGTQRVEQLDDRVFAVRRGEGTGDELLCVTNVTGETITLPTVVGVDVLSDRRRGAADPGAVGIRLGPAPVSLRVVAALDSFKGSLDSLAAGEAVRRGVLSADPSASVRVVAVADGGEGTLDALAAALPSTSVPVDHGRRRSADRSRRRTSCSRTAPPPSRPPAPSASDCSTPWTPRCHRTRRRPGWVSISRRRSPTRRGGCWWGSAAAPPPTAERGCCGPSVRTSRPTRRTRSGDSPRWTRPRCPTSPGSSSSAT